MAAWVRVLVLVLVAACLAGPATARADEVSVPADDGRLALPALWLPAPGAAPQPVVVGLHGCGGPRDSRGRWAASWRRHAAYLNAEGIGLLVIDSLGARGLGSLCATPDARRPIHEDDRRDDAQAALAWLAARPEVDAGRLALVGWSHGAQTVLVAVNAVDARPVRANAPAPRAAVAFYPGCSRALRQRDYAVAVPTLLLVGEKDDWTPAATCVRLAQRLRDAVPAGRAPLEIEVYADSYHGFDGLAPVRVISPIGNTRSGTATVGGNDAARRASHARLFDFLSAQLDVALRLTHEARLALPPLPAQPAAR